MHLLSRRVIEKCGNSYIEDMVFDTLINTKEDRKLMVWNAFGWS